MPPAPATPRPLTPGAPQPRRPWPPRRRQRHAGTGGSGGSADSAASSHVTEVALQPGQGREIKLAMREGARVDFEWTVEGGVVNSDTHADRPGTPYHGYEKGRRQSGDRACWSPPSTACTAGSGATGAGRPSP